MADTFVFGPGSGSDVILDLTVTGDACYRYRLLMVSNDRIDLSAFGIRPGDLEDLISERNDNVIINLEDYGGGRITVQDTYYGSK